MATGQYIGVNGVARKVTTPYIGVEGVARNVTAGYVGVDGVARLFYAPEGGTVVLEVEKITSNTYANETTYENEEFILLDIYPKTGGTVNVTYGGLTKTITDTSGAVSPNAQQVFFGTFNGVSDSVTTPASGTLTIEGDYRSFGCGTYYNAKSSFGYCNCVTEIVNFGEPKNLPDQAFRNCTSLISVTIPSSVGYIGSYSILPVFGGCNNLQTVIISNGTTLINGGAFSACTSLISVTIPSSVTTIIPNPFRATDTDNFITVDGENDYYRIDGNCLIEVETNALISGFNNSVIPSYVETISGYAFEKQRSLKSVTLPTGLSSIGSNAFSGCSSLTSVTVPASVTSMSGCFGSCPSLTDLIMLSATPPTLDISTYSLLSSNYNTTITVPAGCGATYKAATGWSEYADRIAEAS